jgi:hypothetical protein
MSGALQASPESRASYMSCYRSAIKALFADRTLAQMPTRPQRMRWPSF